MWIKGLKQVDLVARAQLRDVTARDRAWSVAHRSYSS